MKYTIRVDNKYNHKIFKQIHEDWSDYSETDKVLAIAQTIGCAIHSQDTTKVILEVTVEKEAETITARELMTSIGVEVVDII